MVKLVKISCDCWASESRDKRELSLCKEMGMDVSVFAKEDKDHQSNNVAGFNVIRCSTKVLPDKAIFKIPNRLLSLNKWILKVRKLNADILSCHDLIALTIGYCSNIGKRHKAKLVYDSHEFELGRNAKRSKTTTNLIKKLEGFLIKRSVFTIVVNDCIADELVKIYKLKNRPVVVRSTPTYWELDSSEIASKRAEICSKLKCDTNTFLVMYHGVVMGNRGIEYAIHAIEKLNDVKLVILGNGSESYLQSLHNLCSEIGVKDRVLFLPAVSHEELYKYVSAVDVGLVNIVAKYKSYYFALPNKFFENVQSLTPVIVSNFPELSSLVNKYNIGIEVDPENIEMISSAIKRLRDDKDLYRIFKENLIQAKSELCWEQEKRILRDAYFEIM